MYETLMYLQPCAGTMIDWPEYFGVIRSPAGGGAKSIQEGRKWAFDNGAFTQVFNPTKFFKTLDTLLPFYKTCLFIVLPDKVGDAEETLVLHQKWISEYRKYPFPVAFVAQDGQELLELPSDYDILFVGGTDKFKLGRGARICCSKTTKSIHVGRVNSYKRLLYSARTLKASSVDGTYYAVARRKDNPEIAKRTMIDWFNRLHNLNQFSIEDFI